MAKYVFPKIGLASGLLAATLLAGCSVGPDFHALAAPAGAAFAAGSLATRTTSAPGPDGGAQQFVQGMDIPGQWWRLFGSPSLDALIKQALAANPTLAAAQASLRVAEENVLAQQGSFFPSIGLDVSDSQNMTPTRALTPVAASGKPAYSLFTGKVTVSYAPDVFGLNRRTVESYAAQADNQRYQLEASYLTLTSNVVMAAVQEAGLRAEIAAQQDVIDADRQLLQIITHQVAVGEIARAALLQQQAMLAQAQEMLPPLQKQLAAEDDALKALAGGFPNDPLTGFDLLTLHLPQDLPLSLPSRLVAQRPDILAASANMHAVSAQIGIAIANRLPQFPLSAAFGTSPNAIANAFTPYNQFYEIVGGLSAPIFQGGTLLHRERAAKAQFDAAAAQYRQTVISAFQNVGDVLRALQSDADTLRAAETAEAAASQSLAIARGDLQQGAIAYEAVLNAEQIYQSTHLALVQADVARFTDTVALFQALGGGWWNRRNVSGVATTAVSRSNNG
ncbi:MAG TPA: efflux transporter outer membrane subunit [Acetobacteraceae bacterium]|nr:efflux transporter outer membrane subunit [Acetobacteraceae bacterium]